MASERKLREAAEKISEAEKLLKTGFLKWKPDYDSAAQYYQEAATLYKTAKAMDLCRDTLQKAAECYVKNGSFFSAAKQLEQAGLISRDLGDIGAVVGFFERAVNLYVESRSPDTAALVLERGAKILQDKGTYMENAIQFYKRAAELVMIEDKHRQAGEFYGNAARLYMKLKDYDSAINQVRQQKACLGDDERAQGRFAVVLCLLQFGRGDEVAARKEFNDGLGYMEAHQVETLQNLIQGFEARDEDLIRHALNDPFIRNMDTEYTKLARDLVQRHCTGRDTTAKSAPASANNAGDVTQDGGDQKEEELDFGGGLC